MRSVKPGRAARLARHLPEPLRRRTGRLPGALAPPVETGTRTPRIAIIGSGFGGLGLGARLRQAGIESFTIYEKADGVGGTWRDNTYPGAACDVPSHLYSLSFAPKTDWTRKFPEQPEILDYLESVADTFGLREHLRLGTAVAGLHFDDVTSTWLVDLADGTSDEVDVVVAATGQLNRPSIPDLDGLDDFEGTAFHSARWDHGHDLAGRDVAVIGVGASAIQFVPEVASVARTVTVFQRSSNYVAPKPDGPFSPRARRLLEAVPGLRRLYRLSIWVRLEARFAWFRQGSRSAQIIERTFSKALAKQVSERLPADVLIPDYTFGCKRILISNDWYPTLHRENVTVVTEPVLGLSRDGVVSGAGHHAADTVIFGTGFQSTGFLAPMRITNGTRDLRDDWADGAEAHLGIAVDGYPNLFLLYGPNTNLGHNSIVFMLERQIAYVLTLIRRMADEGLSTLTVRPEVQKESNAKLQGRLAKTVWATGCHSWYRTASGKITNNWSNRTATYWWHTAVPRRSHFHATPASEDSAAARGAEAGRA